MITGLISSHKNNASVMPVKKTKWMLSSTFPLFAPLFFIEKNFKPLEKLQKLHNEHLIYPSPCKTILKYRYKPSLLGVRSTEYWLGSISQFILLMRMSFGQTEVTVWITTEDNKIKHKNITVFALSTMTLNSNVSNFCEQRQKQTSFSCFKREEHTL